MTPEERLEKLRRLAELKGISTEAPKKGGMPEWFSDLANYGPGFLKETGKNFLKGAVSTADSVLQSHPFIGPVANAYGIAAGGKTPAQAIKDLPVEDMGLWGKVTQGAGGAVLGALSKAEAVPAALVGAISALGGDIGGNFAEKSDLPRLAGEIPGALVAGGLAGLGLGPAQTSAQADLRRAYNASAKGAGGASALDDLVRNKLFDYNQAGSRTATLADAFPEDSAIVALANKARNSTVDNALRAQTQGRLDDIDQIILEAIKETGPRTGSPMDRVVAVKNAAKARLASARARVNAPYEALKKLPDIPDEILMQRIRSLEAQAGKPGQATSDAEALKASIAIMLDEQNPTKRLILRPQNKLELKDAPGPQRRPEALSLNAAEFSAKDANLNARPGAQITPRAERSAQSTVSTELASLPEPWGSAYKEARRRGSARRETLYDPLKEGSIGKLAGMNPNSEIEPGLGALDNVWKGRDAGEVLQLVKQLEKGEKGVTKGIARALVENRASMTPADKAPNALRPQAGLPSREAFDALINKTGGRADAFNQKLDIAEELSRRGLSTGLHDAPRLGPLQLIRPFRTVDLTSTFQMERTVQNQIAEYLAKPSLEKLAELQKLAMFDPSVRIALSTIIPQMGLFGSNKE